MTEIIDYDTFLLLLISILYFIVMRHHSATLLPIQILNSILKLTVQKYKNISQHLQKLQSITPQKAINTNFN